MPIIKHMWAWRLSRGLMAAGPLLFLSGVTLNGHIAVPSAPKRTSEETAHERLLAYVQPVSEVDALALAKPQVRERQLDQVVDKWIGSAEKGRLKTVFASQFGGASVDDITNDIKLAKLFLMSQLSNRAARAQEEGKPSAEAAALVRIVELASIDKYADFNLVHQFATVQIKCLKRLANIAPKVEPKTRIVVAERLSRTQALEGRLCDVATHVRRLHTEYLACSDKTPLPIEVAHCYVALAEATENPTTKALDTLRSASRNAMDNEFTKIGMAGRLAVKTESTYSNALTATQKTYQSTR